MKTKQDLLDHLRHTGERITMPRQAVIEALCDLGGHQTTQSIQKHLEETGVCIQEPTVYRVLQWLKDLALVCQTDMGQSGITYELLSTPLHHHLICLQCGAVQDLDDSAMAPLRDHVRQRYNFEPRIDHMAIYGICKRCRGE